MPTTCTSGHHHGRISGDGSRGRLRCCAPAPAPRPARRPGSAGAAATNVLGSVLPVAELVARARAVGALTRTDGVRSPDPAFDVAIVGGGPAGRVLAGACAARGLRTALVDVTPDRPWRITYGAFTADLPGDLPKTAVATRARGRAVALHERDLGWEYTVLDVPGLRAQPAPVGPGEPPDPADRARAHRARCVRRAGGPASAPTARSAGRRAGPTRHLPAGPRGVRRRAGPRSGSRRAPRCARWGWPSGSPHDRVDAEHRRCPRSRSPGRRRW